MTVFPFQPSTAAPFQFQPVLDGRTYSATVLWLLFGARFYLSLAAGDGTQVWFGAIVGSSPGVGLKALSWANGTVSVVTSAPHGYRVATTVPLSILGSAPDAYNGQFDCLITGASSFRYPLAMDPGAATVFGSASYDVNLIGGVGTEVGDFFTSSVVFRVPANQFEVSP